jgi:hypothetical protein
MTKITLQELESQVLIVPFIDMEPHIKRGAVLVVEEGLSIADVGLKLATDNKTAVAALLADQKLSKASHLEFEQWRQHKQFFKILIIQPFVLAQNYVSLNTPLPN